MALLRYLQVRPRRGDLPDPAGTLSSVTPSSAIAEANAAVAAFRQEATEMKEKRESYIKLSDEVRATIGKFIRVRIGIRLQRDPSRRLCHNLPFVRRKFIWRNVR